MDKNIIFLAFENDGASQFWRLKKEDDFLEADKQKGDSSTNKINEIRSGKPDSLKKYDRIYSRAQNDVARARVLLEKQKLSDDEVKEYYKKLHKEKEKRQKEWINELMESVAGSFRKAIDDTGAGNKDNSIIVAALPEFFWTDINDDNKHVQDIKNYHKPLYLSVIEDVFTGEQNPIAQLTKDYNNLIFFAGTAMYKEISKEDENTNKEIKREKEKIMNTLFIYHTGALQVKWGKQHFSHIDGFNGSASGQYYVIKNKKGEATDKNAVPEIEFKGKKFAFDICLDFCVEDRSKNPTVYQPLSAERLNGSPVDVNVLIAGGMSIYDNNQLKDYAMRASSNYILRCDASPDNAGCYCEIVDKKNQKNTSNLIDFSILHTGVFDIVQNDVTI